MDHFGTLGGAPPSPPPSPFSPILPGWPPQGEWPAREKREKGGRGGGSFCAQDHVVRILFTNSPFLLAQS